MAIAKRVAIGDVSRCFRPTEEELGDRSGREEPAVAMRDMGIVIRESKDGWDFIVCGNHLARRRCDTSSTNRTQ